MPKTPKTIFKRINNDKISQNNLKSGNNNININNKNINDFQTNINNNEPKNDAIIKKLIKNRNKPNDYFNNPNINKNNYITYAEPADTLIIIWNLILIRIMII